MAWLAILVWVVVPFIAGCMFLVLPKYLKNPSQKKWAKTGGLVVLIAPWIISSGVKWYYDQQIRELCAKDGGIRVYETVKLPVDKFNQYGQPNFHIPITPYNKLKDTDEYYLEWEVTNLRRGNPKLERSFFRLIRRNDQKYLGDSVTYWRSGGDIPGPWHGSSFTCPQPTKHQSLESSIFVKRDKQ